MTHPMLSLKTIPNMTRVELGQYIDLLETALETRSLTPLEAFRMDQAYARRAFSKSR